MVRLPRWLVVILLASSVLAAFGAGAWWWMVWPERTARQFHGFLIEQKWDDAATMLVYSGVDYPPNTVVAWLAATGQTESHLEPQPRLWRDMYRGSRRFRLGAFYFKAERGQITQWNTWSSL
jgi:hypothetical protein